MTDAQPQSGGRAASDGNRSVARALAILELFADVERPLSLADIAKELNLPKSSALVLLRALTGRDFATVDDEGRYSLGVRSFFVGAAYLRSMTPARAVETELERLASEQAVASHFAVLEGDEVIYLAKHDPPGAHIKLASSVGARLPAAITAVGKAQLAHLPVPVSGIDAELGADLHRVRERGYAIDRGQTAAGICCVAAPVLTPEGCCGAIGVSFLIHDDRELGPIVDAVMAAAVRASERLGGGVAGGEHS